MIPNLKCLDLFSGIGGFAIAAHQAGFETTQLVEIDPWNQKLLAQNFPSLPIHDDITTFNSSLGQFDIITGGFPCQDISSANPNGRGLAGKRSGLFYEIIRLIRQCRPRYVVLENVSALLSKHGGRDMGTVLWSLSECGYDAEWQTISAASMGAPHLRERIFIVAYPNRYANRPAESGITQAAHGLPTLNWEKDCPTGNVGRTNFIGMSNKFTPNPNSDQCQRWKQISDGQNGAQNPDTQWGCSPTPNTQSSRRRSPWHQDDETGSDSALIGGGSETTPNAMQSGLQGRQKQRGAGTGGTQWDKQPAGCLCSEPEDGTTQPRIRGMDDGFSYWLDTPQPAPLSIGTPDRKHRLKALGNAVTPQQALIPMLRIKQLIAEQAIAKNIIGSES